jgi:riboflavin kinase/FMN adenylyltransferase
VKTPSFHIYRHTPDAPLASGGSVVTIGNFDGVHRGHLAVIDHARLMAHKLGVPLIALTFEPHPRAVLRPHEAPVRLTGFAEKARRLKAAGVNGLYVVRFTKAYARTAPEAFIKDTLVGALKAKAVVVGHDFCFGKDRSAGFALLKELGPALGYDVAAVPAYEVNGQVCSSSRIREALARGERGLAAHLLGRPLPRPGTGNIR